MDSGLRQGSIVVHRAYATIPVASRDRAKCLNKTTAMTVKVYGIRRGNLCLQ